MSLIKPVFKTIQQRWLKSSTKAFVLVDKALRMAFFALVRLYQLTLGPYMGGQCRFEPSCSHFALEAFKEHVFWKATWLSVHRILRCHPFGSYGFDPVPKHEPQTKKGSRLI